MKTVSNSLRPSEPTDAAADPGGLDSVTVDADRHDNGAMDKARCAVAEYLRDLGLRDPDVVAQASRRIVAEAQRHRPSGDDRLLCETAISQTVKQLERWLEVLAAQSGTADQSQRLGSVVAARLPGLLDRFPRALNGQRLPEELLDTLRNGLTPVVPSPRPRRMRRQVLPLIPSCLKRFGVRVQKLMAKVETNG